MEIGSYKLQDELYDLDKAFLERFTSKMIFEGFGVIDYDPVIGFYRFSMSALI